MERKRNSSSSGRRRRSAAAIDHQSKLYLPAEVIYNILKRLPVRSLLCFKSVSKLWFRAISEPKFAEDHFLLQSANLNPDAFLDRQTILLVPKKNYYQFPFLDLATRKYACSTDRSDYFKVGSHQVPMTSLPLQEPKTLCGSCNGLLLFRLLHRCHTFVIWNPSTNACADFFYPCNYNSQLDGDHDHDHGNILMISGLCYDSNSSDDYKVVFTTRRCISPIINPSVLAVVYSLKSNSWKEVGEVPYYNSSECNIPVIVNGALHWFVAIHNDGRHSRAIVYFDLSDEMFKELPLSKCLQERLYGYDSYESKHPLALHKGRLCILYYHTKFRPELEVWIMNEYGVRESWTKPFTIPLHYSAILEVRQPYQFCFTEKDRILCTGPNGKAAIYSPKQKKWEVISAVQEDHAPFAMTTYVPSLVSPSFGNQGMNGRPEFTSAGRCY